MADFRIKWKDKEVIKRLDTYLVAKLRRVALFLEQKAKLLISRGNGGGDNPSRPGEPPKVQSGALRASISNEVTRKGRDIVARVGTVRGPTSIYGARWEFSKRREKATGLPETRPFLRPTLERYKHTIYRMILT